MNAIRIHALLALCCAALCTTMGCDDEEADNTDVGFEDLVVVDTGLGDYGSSDTGRTDTGMGDTGQTDRGIGDTGHTDTGEDTSEDPRVVDHGMGHDADEHDADLTATDEPDAELEDTTEPDADPADVEDHDADVTTADEPDASEDAGVCSTIEDRVRSEWSDLNSCEISGQCRTTTNPFCPLGPCYSHYNYDADRSTLTTLLSQWRAEECGSDTECVCDDPPDVVACQSGQCGECSRRCTYICRLASGCLQNECGCDIPVPRSCPGLEERIEAEALALGQGCRVDEDCSVARTVNCGRTTGTSGIGCWLPIVDNASTGALDRLLDQASANGCADDETTCICGRPAIATCDRGVCRFPSL